MDGHLKAVGVLLMALAAVHIVFPAYFGWRDGLAQLSPINREMMYVHTGFVALTVFLMGLLSLTSAEALARTPLGRRVALGLAVFWGVRLLVQFFGYSPSLWRGKRFETGVHVAFSVLWSYVTWVFGATYWLGAA